MNAFEKRFCVLVLLGIVMGDIVRHFSGELRIGMASGALAVFIGVTALAFSEDKVKTIVSSVLLPLSIALMAALLGGLIIEKIEPRCTADVVLSAHRKGRDS